MKILFVASGNSKMEISPIVHSQGESIRKEGVDLDYFLIRGKGLLNYLRHVNKLKKNICAYHYELIHAHYGLTAIISLLTLTRIKIVVSFMGDDILGSNRQNGSYKLIGEFWKNVHIFLARYFYASVIVKSHEMKIKLHNIKSIVIPNGVNFDLFKTTNKKQAMTKLGILEEKQIVVFASDPSRHEKNYQLVLQSLQLIDNSNLLLLIIHDKSKEEMVDYYNAADVLILTSFHEGSPNVIKEAMACNCPIVTTDVGDVTWVIGETKGCFIAGFEPEDFSFKINLALTFASKYGRTTGRERIRLLGLESTTVAKKIITVYNEILKSDK